MLVCTRLYHHDLHLPKAQPSIRLEHHSRRTRHRQPRLLVPLHGRIAWLHLGFWSLVSAIYALLSRPIPYLLYSYFKSKFHCFDALVILAGFVIDVLLRGVIEEVASLVVILRLWRVVKIIEELSVGAEEQMDSLRERIELLEHENAHLMEELKQLKSKKTDSQSHTGSVR